MENKRIGTFYHPELDGLRFFAFLLVFIHNAPCDLGNPIWKLFHEYGWVGVDLFFCLSAFLITKILISELEEKKQIGITNFYIRRILRIWPLYFFYIVIIVCFQDWSRSLFLQLVGLSTFTFNFIFPSITTQKVFLFSHLWTISYEEQFYGIIPWVTGSLVNKKNAAGKLLLLIFLIGTIIRALLIYYQAKHPIIYMVPFTHFEAILCGVAIGSGSFNKIFERVQGLSILVVGVLLITLLFFLPNTYEIGWNLMKTYPLAGFGMSLIVYSVVYKQELFIMNFLKLRPIIYLGKISFGLYIFHIIALAIVDYLYKHIPIEHNINDYAIVMVTVGLVITIIFSMISYQFIERPFLKLKQTFSSVNSRPI